MFKKLTPPNLERIVTEKWKYKDKIYISIVCPCFNQELYIKDAVDSFLSQETEYRFEIIIHDDASTDGTRDILLEYKNKYPSIIKLILQEENQYSQGKQIAPLGVEHADGEYIALCEGDDFWVSKDKIQKQISFFIENKDVSLIHTNCFDLNQSTGLVTKSPIPKLNNTLESLFENNGVRTLSSMFRKESFLEFYNENNIEANNWKLGDWPLWIYLSTKGKIFFLQDYYCVYRILPESASNTANIVKNKSFINSTIDMLIYMDHKYNNDKSIRVISNRFVRSNIAIGIDKHRGLEKKASLFYKLLYKFNLYIKIKSIFKWN